MSKRLAGLLAVTLAAFVFAGCPKIKIAWPAPPSPSPVPSVSPPPTAEPGPAPTPEASPTPSTEPTPKPTSAPIPTPDGGCRTPQGGEYTLLNSGDPNEAPVDQPLAERFMRELVLSEDVPREHPTVGLADLVADAAEELTGCRRYETCPIQGDPQAFFAKITAHLRAAGLCAGQFEEGMDGIAVAPGRDQAPDWAEGLWAEFHVVAYGGPSIAWGKILGGKNAVWRVSGGSEPGPGPEPTPTPTAGPPPTPRPTPPPTPSPRPSATPTPGPTPQPGTCPLMVSVEIRTPDGIAKKGVNTLPRNTPIRLRAIPHGAHPHGFDADFPPQCQRQDAELSWAVSGMAPPRPGAEAAGAFGYWHSVTYGGPYSATATVTQRSTGATAKQTKRWEAR